MANKLSEFGRQLENIFKGPGGGKLPSDPKSVLKRVGKGLMRKIPGPDFTAVEVFKKLDQLGVTDDQVMEFEALLKQRGQQPEMMRLKDVTGLTQQGDTVDNKSLVYLLARRAAELTEMMNLSTIKRKVRREIGKSQRHVRKLLQHAAGRAAITPDFSALGVDEPLGLTPILTPAIKVKNKVMIAPAGKNPKDILQAFIQDSQKRGESEGQTQEMMDNMTPGFLDGQKRFLTPEQAQVLVKRFGGEAQPDPSLQADTTGKLFLFRPFDTRKLIETPRGREVEAEQFSQKFTQGVYPTDKFSQRVAREMKEALPPAAQKNQVSIANKLPGMLNNPDEIDPKIIESHLNMGTLSSQETNTFMRLLQMKSGGAVNVLERITSGKISEEDISLAVPNATSRMQAVQLLRNKVSRTESLMQRITRTKHFNPQAGE